MLLFSFLSFYPSFSLYSPYPSTPPVRTNLLCICTPVNHKGNSDYSHTHLNDFRRNETGSKEANIREWISLRKLSFFSISSTLTAYKQSQPTTFLFYPLIQSPTLSVRFIYTHTRSHQDHGDRHRLNDEANIFFWKKRKEVGSKQTIEIEQHQY